MATIRTAANTILTGRIGDKTFYVADSRQIVRQRLNNSNYGEGARRTETQQARRVRWANLVNFYKASKGWMSAAYESKNKGQTDYNKFVQLNINTSSVCLTKDMASAGACVIEPFVVSQGSLKSIDVTKSGNVYITNISYTGAEITDDTTVAEFTAKLIASNNTIVDGMQLSFISYMQNVDALGVPRIICTPYEVTLDKTNQAKLRDYLPEFCSKITNGFLGTTDQIAVGGFAYILSSVVGGKLEVSTQVLTCTNDSLRAEYSSPTMIQKAIESYGVDAEVMLSPISTVANQATTKPVYIQYLLVGSKQYNAGNYVGSASSVTAGAYSLVMSESLSSEDVASVDVYTKVSASGSETRNACSTKSVSGNRITLTGSTISSSNSISKITVTLASGEVVAINFTVAADEGGLSPN